jgi:hypothetical protein
MNQKTGITGSQVQRQQELSASPQWVEATVNNNNQQNASVRPPLPLGLP